MEYTIQKLAKLASISTRTLRYYDEIAILKPARINSSGYRIYGQNQVDQLQQIMFYKELGVGLDEIKEILADSDFDETKALLAHKSRLIEKRAQIDSLIQNVEQTIAYHEGRTIMKNDDKFKGFKQSKVDENEKKYGKEIREKYGNDTVDLSNKKMMGMTQEDFDKTDRLAKLIIETLVEAMDSQQRPDSEIAQKAVSYHKEWLCLYWPKYSKEAHQGLGEMYVGDQRFTQYYDQHKEGMAAFLRDAINYYVTQ